MAEGPERAELPKALSDGAANVRDALGLWLCAYEALPRHVPGWIAARVGMSAPEERRCIELLERTGQVRRDRLKAGAAGASSYNPFTVSEVDFERLRALHRSYLRQIRAIIAESQPCERVVLACAQMLELSPPVAPSP